MSIQEVRRTIQMFLQQEAPKGPGTIAPLESLAFLSTDDLEFQNKHLLHELCDFLGTTAAVHEYVEEHTLGDHHAFQKYWQQLHHDPHYKPTSDLRVEGGAIIALHKNLSAALHAYERLGSDAPLSYKEQADCVRDVKFLPRLLHDLSAHFSAVEAEDAMPEPEHAQIKIYRDSAQRLSDAVADQLIALDGRGRNGNDARPSSN